MLANFCLMPFLDLEMVLLSVLFEGPLALTKVQIDELILLTTTNAFSMGLLYLPPAERQPTVGGKMSSECIKYSICKYCS